MLTLPSLATSAGIFRLRLLAALLLASLAIAASAQEPAPYTRSSILSIYAQYANTSSHIVEGVTRRRRFAQAGVTYDRRFLAAYGMAAYYEFAASPLTFIQNPITTRTFTFTNGQTIVSSGPRDSFCTPVAPYQQGTNVTVSVTCSTRWTYAGSVSPLGFRLNFRNGHRLQPTISGNGSVVASTDQVPVDLSKALNYMGELGVGLDLFTTPTRSWSLQYRLYHLSNGYTADNNPGIDGQLIRLALSFGR